ncbi:MAG: hypothetical protein V4568_04375 [Pseudomonadota bacterium]
MITDVPNKYCRTLFLLCIALLPTASWSTINNVLSAQNPSSFAEANFEKLRTFEITLISKKTEKQFESVAAVFLIGHENTHLAGAVSRNFSYYSNDAHLCASKLDAMLNQGATFSSTFSTQESTS